MKPKIYISAYCIFIGSIIQTQNNTLEEKQDNLQPVITVNEIEEDAQQASDSQKQYIMRKEQINSTSAENNSNKELTATSNMSEKKLKKPEKQQ